MVLTGPNGLSALNLLKATSKGCNDMGQGAARVHRKPVGAHLVEEALVVEGLPGGSHVGLAQRDLLAYVTLAVARQLALLVPVRVLGFKAPLALALSPPLLPAAMALLYELPSSAVHSAANFPYRRIQQRERVRFQGCSGRWRARSHLWT